MLHIMILGQPNNLAELANRGQTKVIKNLRQRRKKNNKRLGSVYIGKGRRNYIE